MASNLAIHHRVDSVIIAHMQGLLFDDNDTEVHVFLGMFRKALVTVALLLVAYNLG